jgi:hypothetical protein
MNSLVPFAVDSSWELARVVSGLLLIPARWVALPPYLPVLEVVTTAEGERLLNSFLHFSVTCLLVAPRKIIFLEDHVQPSIFPFISRICYVLVLVQGIRTRSGNNSNNTEYS